MGMSNNDLIYFLSFLKHESKAYGVSNYHLKLQSKKFSRTWDIPSFPTQGWAATAFYASNWNETYLSYNMGYREIIIYIHNWSNMTLKKLPTVGTRLTHSWVKYVPKPIFWVGPTFASILSVNFIFVYIVERYAYSMYVHLSSLITVYWEVTRECRMLPTLRTLSLWQPVKLCRHWQVQLLIKLAHMSKETCQFGWISVRRS